MQANALLIGSNHDFLMKGYQVVWFYVAVLLWAGTGQPFVKLTLVSGAWLLD